MNKRLFLSRKMISRKNLVLMLFKQKQPQAKVTSDFLDYHNDICPGCNKALKVSNNTVNLGTISICYLEKRNLGVLYGLCKNCEKDLYANKVDTISSNAGDYIEKTLFN